MRTIDPIYFGITEVITLYLNYIIENCGNSLIITNEFPSRIVSSLCLLHNYVKRWHGSKENADMDYSIEADGNIYILTYKDSKFLAYKRQ